MFAGLGGAIGIVIGIEVISPLMPPSYAKIFFTSTWLSFAVALYWINRYKEREVHTDVSGFQTRHAVILVLVGIVGGTISGVTGSGLDIVTFSLLVLCFRINEKIATPTSVVLMGMNAVFGFFWKQGFGSGMAVDAWNYWYVCVPIVVIGAPAGAWFIKNRSRSFVAWFLYFSIIVQYVAALIILPMTAGLIVFSIIVFTLGALLFRHMSRFGEQRLVFLRELSLQTENAIE